MAALATAVAIAVSVAVLALGPARAASGFPQAKVNHVDVTQAPLVKVYVSFLDRELRSVDPKLVEAVTVSRKPERERAVELFSIVDGEAVFPPLDEDAPPGVLADPDDPPTLTLLEEEERGMAIVVAVPGFAAPEYRDGTLGERTRSGAALFFKKLGKNHRMNVVWYNDDVWTFVRAKGRLRELSVLDDMRADCEAWTVQQLTAEEADADAAGEQAEGGDGLAPDEAVCGLLDDYGEVGKVIAATAFEGFYPNLFGLGAKPCAPPANAPTRRGFTREDEAGAESPLPALDAALQMLVRDAAPGQPRALILLGDGKDGYIYRLDECRTKLQTDCRLIAKTWRGLKECVDKGLKNQIIAEQQRFARRLGTWLGLAKAADVRIYAVAGPNAEGFERERLEVLALRSGGTVRVAEDANDVVDLYTELIEELSGQYVLTFVDEQALPGSEVAYQVKMKVKGGRKTAPPYRLSIPPAPEGLAVWVAQQRAWAEAKLGKNVLLAIVIVVGVIVALILLKVLLVIGKKLLGKGGKAAAGKAKKAGKVKVPKGKLPKGKLPKGK